LIGTPIVAAALAGALAQGNAAFAAGDFATALADYRTSIAQDGKSFAAYFGAAQAALYANDLRSATEYLDDAQVLAEAKQAAPVKVLLAEVQSRIRMAQAQPISRTVSIAMADVDPLPLFSVQVNGRQAYFMLDTGAPNLIVDPDFAKELGLKMTGGFNGTFAGGKHATVRDVLVPTFRIGSVTLHNVQCSALPTRPIPFFGDKRVDGIIGTIFLSQFLSTIDYPNARLVLRPRSASPAFEQSLPAGATTVPFWYVPDHFLLARGSVNALNNQLFLVDSGLAGGGFGPSQKTVEDANIGLDEMRTGTGVGGGGAVTVIPFTLDRLCLGTACRANVRGLYTPQGSPLDIFPFKVAGIISHQFLEHFAWTIDFDAMRMVLQGS
jgi:hypothetical protein